MCSRSVTASACRVADERKRHVDFGVLREALRVLQKKGAARAVYAVSAGTQCAAGAAHVAQGEIGRIHQDPTATLRRDSEAPQHRSRERVFDGLSLERIGAARSERLVGLDQQHARADALEEHQASGSARAAVEADVVRAKAGRESRRIEELGIEARDLEKHRSRSVVPVQRKVAVDLLHATGALLNRRRWTGGRSLTSAPSAAALDCLSARAGLLPRFERRREQSDD